MILDYINQNYNNFTQKEKLIANYLLEKQDCIIKMSAKEIADITGTSAPTVVRFAKKLGFESLNEMKLKLSLNLRNKNNTRKESFEYLDSDLKTKSIISGIGTSMHKIIDETILVIDENELDKAIELLIKAKNIYIFAVGVSSLVAMDFLYKLSRINKRCIVSADPHLQITSSVLMEEGDVGIAISYSGETKEVLICAENTKKTNIPLIVLTKASIKNKLANLADLLLEIPSCEKTLREGAITSRVSQLLIIDMLFIGMTRNEVGKVEEKLIITSEAVSYLKEKS